MSKFIEVNVRTEFKRNGIKSVRTDAALINCNHIVIMAEADGFATIAIAGENGALVCQESYEEVKRMVLNE